MMLQGSMMHLDTTDTVFERNNATGIKKKPERRRLAQGSTAAAAAAAKKAKDADRSSPLRRLRGEDGSE